MAGVAPAALKLRAPVIATSSSDLKRDAAGKQGSAKLLSVTGIARQETNGGGFCSRRRARNSPMAAETGGDWLKLRRWPPVFSALR